VYGNQTPVALKMGRSSNLFVSRNDMDQSQEYGNTAADSMGKTDVPLYEDLAPLNDGKDGFLPKWKQDYNFVGSYYINIGNNQPNGQYTDWAVSQPLYKKYEGLGNEIGTHSYTHPEDTNAQGLNLAFEFNQSMNEIATKLNPTWQTLAIRGAAVPGAPETVATAKAILPYVDYLSGGGSVLGSGYPSAIGYLTPADTKVYYSPNMTFDFTLIEFGVPEGNPAVAVKKTAAQAEQYWAAEYDRLMKRASQPIIHWPWHDYGPTSGTAKGYTASMFQNTIAKAFNTGAEFATGADVAQRINTFKNAKLTVTQNASQYTATVNSANVGKFSIGLNLPAGQKIQNVTNWYAYNDDKVFLPDAGGTFVIQAGTAADAVTHITALPMRAKLLSVTGNGANLTASFEGEGTVTVALAGAPSTFNISSDSGVLTTSGNTASLKFATWGTHTITITPAVITPVNHPPVAANDSLTTTKDTPLSFTASSLLGNDSDPDGDTLSISSISTTSQGRTITGSYSYTPPTGFTGTDTFTYTISDGKGGTATATVTVNVTAPAPVVTVYDLANYAGTSQGFAAGTYTITGQVAATGRIGDNTVTSVKVTAGHSVKLCDTPAVGSLCKTYTANTATIASSPASSNMNNKTSYLIVN
jgi:hypothetical protein